MAAQVSKVPPERTDRASVNGSALSAFNRTVERFPTFSAVKVLSL